MDAILNDEELKLKAYVLNYSKNVNQAEILVTNVLDNGESAVVVANVDFKYDTIFNFKTLDGYYIHCHSDYLAVIERVISILFEKVEIWEKETLEE